MQTTTLLHPDIRLTPDPVSTPEKFRSGHGHLELTPVWQYVIKKNKFPTNVDRQEVFSELAVRLQHPEWQVRLHGTRVLAYIVPAVGPQLDALMSPTTLPAVITNLAHFSPALRSSSMDAILVYVQHSSDPEFVLKSMIVQGLDVPGAKSSLTVNVMECVPVVLQQIVKKNGERPIAIPTFVHLVTALSNKMVQATFQQAAVYCLDRVKEIVGRNKFDHYLETFHPIIKKDFEVLCEVYRISSSSGRDSSISSYDDEDDVETPKTPRRVTFGGELIKIRSPDVSDDPEVTKFTGIPIPVKPALSIPKHPNDKVDNKSTKLPIQQRNNKHTISMKMDKPIQNVESSVNISRMGAFSVTTVSETRQEPHKIEDLKRPPDDGQNKTQSLSPNGGSGDILSATSNVPIEKSNGSAILETRRVVDLDDRLIRPGIIGTMDIGKKALSQTSINSFIKPPNVQLYSTTVGTLQLKNDCSKPIAEVKPTTSAAVTKLSSTESRRSIGTHLKKQEKRLETGPNFTPFNEPQKALQLVSIQINSPEWEAAVTGLQNISRLSMFHGKELRAGSLQPFARKVATHIKSLRSQVARAACTAVQKMFSYVPKSVEPDVEAIASALFPRTADTNKFLRIQSTEALNAMVDNVIPSKCVYVITSKGIKHGNRLVRAEACRLLARLVDKLGVGGTLHLPSDARDTMITSATSMVFDNTPTSRQAAQYILARLSEDPRGVELISSAVSPNVKATLNKSLSRIFLK